jgi:hypothetical protein
MKRHKWYIRSFYFRIMQSSVLWSSSLIDHSTCAITVLSSLLKKSFLWTRLTWLCLLFVKFCIKKITTRHSTQHSKSVAQRAYRIFAWDLVGAGNGQCGADAEKVPIFLHRIGKEWNKHIPQVVWKSKQNRTWNCEDACCQKTKDIMWSLWGIQFAITFNNSDHFQQILLACYS